MVEESPPRAFRPLFPVAIPVDCPCQFCDVRAECPCLSVPVRPSACALGLFVPEQQTGTSPVVPSRHPRRVLVRKMWLCPAANDRTRHAVVLVQCSYAIYVVVLVQCPCPPSAVPVRVPVPVPVECPCPLSARARRVPRCPSSARVNLCFCPSMFLPVECSCPSSTRAC